MKKKRGSERRCKHKDRAQSIIIGYRKPVGNDIQQ